MKQSHILAGVGVAMLVLFYVTSVQREGFDTSRGQFIKATGGDDSVWFQPAGTNDKYPLSSCTLCGSENFCDSIVMKPLSVTNALTTKSLFTCSMLSAPSAPPPAAAAVFALPPLPAGFALPPLPAAGATGAAPSRLSTVLADIAYLKSLGIPDDGTSANEAMRRALAEKASLEGGTPARSAAPTPTPSSNTSTAGRTDWSGYISSLGTAEDLQKSLTDRAKSTYGSFLSVIASGIAKFGIVVIVGASIVVGVLVVWSMWNAFIGRSTTPAVPMVGAPLMR